VTRINEPPRRRRIWLKLFLIVVLLAVGGTLVLWWIQSAAFESELAAIDAQGLPVNGAQLNDFYRVPEGSRDTTQEWMLAIDAAAATAEGQADDELPIVGNGPTPIPPAGTEWEQLQAASEFLDQNAEALSLIRDAADAGGCARFPVDFRDGIQALLPYAQNSRAVSRLLMLDAHVASHNGDSGRALADVKGMFRLAAAFQTEPAMVSQMVRMAIISAGCGVVADLLPGVEWTDTQLASLQEYLRSADLLQTSRIGIIGERAICLDEIARTAPRLTAQSNASLALKFFAKSLEGLDQGWAGAIQAQRDVSQEMRQNAAGIFNRIRHFAVLLLMPAQEQFTIAGARTAASQRCAICLIAAKRYFLQNGQYPSRLEDISIELFTPGIQSSSDTIDPFTGTPLKYQLTAEQLVIYSVGSDGKDDGGSVDSVQNAAPLDVGVRLPLQNAGAESEATAP